MIFYESPFRLVKTLEQLAEILGEERKASVSRELTKIHEENARGTLKELIYHFNSKVVKGEIVIIVEGLHEKVEKKKAINTKTILIFNITACTTRLIINN